MDISPLGVYQLAQLCAFRNILFAHKPGGFNLSQEYYDSKIFPFMRRAGEQKHVTESYVSIPPALVITDNEGAIWTLGFDYSEAEWKSGKYEYDIVRNGRKTGEFARTIEFRAGKVIILGADGRRVWNGRQFI